MENQMMFRFGFMVVMALVLYILIGTGSLQHLKDAWATYRRKCFIKKYKTTVIGEIVGAEKDERRAVIDFVLETLMGMARGRSGRRGSEMYYPVYSPRVSFTIGDCTYETDANNYTIDEPVIGQKVHVHYNPHNPTKMCIGGVVPENPGTVFVGRQPLRPIAMLKTRKYCSEVVGEVVGIKKKKLGNSGMAVWLGIFLTSKDVYSSIIRYKVLDTMYEIDAGDYSAGLPVIGDKALVLCHPQHPEKACVPTWRKSKKNIEVLKCDEEFVHCLYDSCKRIKIPARWVEEGVKPGSYLVHWYGFYQLE